MAQCRAIATTTGRRCRLEAAEGEELCTVHAGLELEPSEPDPPPAPEPDPDPAPVPEPSSSGWGAGGRLAVGALLAAAAVRLVRSIASRLG